MQRRPDLTCWRLDGREMEAQSSWWDADAPAAGREGGGGVELPAPKDAPVRSFVGPDPFPLWLPISRPNLPPNLYPSPILPARQRTGGKYSAGTLPSTRGNDFGGWRAATSPSREQGVCQRVVGVPPTPNRRQTGEGGRHTRG